MKNTILALMMIWSTAVLAGERVDQLEPGWIDYSLEEGRLKRSWTFHHEQSGESQRIKVRQSTKGSSSKIGSFGKSKRRTTVKFHHPTLDSSAKLVFKGRGFRVKGIAMVGQKRPTTLQLVLGKKQMSKLTFDFDSHTVFSGSLEGKSLEIIQEGDRSYVKNGFLQRTVFRFIPIGSFEIRLDGEVVGWIDTPLYEADIRISLSLAEHLPERTRGHLMSTAMGFFMMSDFLNDLD